MPKPTEKQRLQKRVNLFQRMHDKTKTNAPEGWDEEPEQLKKAKDDLKKMK